MKRTIIKLILRRETVRILVDSDLARVAGGIVNCQEMTKHDSGCSTVPAMENPERLN